MRILFRLTLIVLPAFGVRINAARLISSFHLDLDDCDDVAADSRALYFACHSSHAPGAAPANPPNMDAWVAKLDRRSGKLLFLTQSGGEGVDIAVRIKLDSDGYAYVTGFTGSRNFPITTNALQRAYGGGDSDAFLTKVDPDGRIVYSTYLGGSQADQADAIALSSNGDVWVGGRTWSSDFPHVRKKFGVMGKSDAFLARLHPGDPTVHASMIIGGGNDEKLTGLAVSGNAIFATGYTASADFPVVRPLQAERKGSTDAFLLAVEDRFEGLTFSTYLGGSGDDSGWGVALDHEGNPLVAGITESEDLPVTPNAPQKHRAGMADAFLMKLDQSGQKLLFATYYGGTGLDHSGYDGTNVIVSRAGTIWMAGLTDSRDLAVPAGDHPRYGGGEQDGFLAAFSLSGKLCYGTYAGGTARYLLEGVTFADNETAVYAVGTVIRPISKDSPKPDPKEKYGMFVIGLRAGKDCP